MAVGINESTSILAIEVEVTEGTYIAPQADTAYAQYIEATIDGARETQEREIKTSGLAKAKPIPGTASSEASITLELRGSGTEGGQTDAHNLLKAVFGTNRSAGSQGTSSTGHTSTVINFANTSAYKVGDTVAVLESGAHHISPIITVTANTSITLLVAKSSGSFTDNVAVSKFQTYLPSNTQSDYATLSISKYISNEILRSASGLRPNTFSIADWTTGSLPKMEFGLGGITFSESNVVAPQTPSYDTGLPAVILSSCLYVNGTQIDVNSMALNIDTPNSFLMSTCSADGRIASKKIPRVVTVTIDPYKDDTTFDFFTRFSNNTSVSVFAFSGNIGSTAGEYDLGSIVSFYMPTCTTTSHAVADLEDTSQDVIEYNADGGADGTGTEIYMGII